MVQLMGWRKVIILCPADFETVRMTSLGFLLEFTDPQKGSLGKNCGRIWGLLEECGETPGAWGGDFNVSLKSLMI